MANNWAIVIGINEYEHHPDQNLRYALNDAQAMQAFLCNHAGFPEDQVILCLGAKQHQGQSTYPTLGNLILWLDRKLHPDNTGRVDRFWFFFSGHGLSTEGIDYLITCDSLLEDTQFRIMLSVPQVIASLRRHKQADIVLILDNCRERVGAKNLTRSSLSADSLELACRNDIVTIRSCEYGELSYELAAQEQGAFTYALLEGLRQHTLPTPLEAYVQGRVAELNQASEITCRQTPKISLNASGRGLFPLLPERCLTLADLQALEQRAWKAQAKGEFGLAEQLWWQIIRGAPDQVMWEEAQEAIQALYRQVVVAEVRQDMDQELGQLRQQLQRATDEATEQLEVSEQRQRQVEQLQREKADLEQQLIQLKSASEQLQQLQQQKADLQQRLERLQSVMEKQLATQQQQHETEWEQWQVKAAEQLQRAQDGAMAEIKRLNEKIQTLEQQLQGATQQRSNTSRSNSRAPHQTTEPVVLQSGKGVDYGRLRDLLREGDWKGADQETADRMLEAIGKPDWSKVSREDWPNFPCADLETIDGLWVHYSQGKFGFSVQKEIYVKCGAKLDGKYPGAMIWRVFGDRIQWRVNGQWCSYSQLCFTLDAPTGHLPIIRSAGLGGNESGCFFSSLARRLVKLNP